jgi:c-di-AMP phosphodiesterase-like protein
MARYTWFKAFKEAMADCAVGMIINVPVNFVMINIAFYYDMTALEITIFFTAIFTALALVRKTTMRMMFDKKHHDEIEQQGLDRPK